MIQSSCRSPAGRPSAAETAPDAPDDQQQWMTGQPRILNWDHLRMGMKVRWDKEERMGTQARTKDDKCWVCSRGKMHDCF
jgi:hypothetical protein